MKQILLTENQKRILKEMIEETTYTEGLTDSIRELARKFKCSTTTITTILNYCKECKVLKTVKANGRTTIRYFTKDIDYLLDNPLIFLKRNGVFDEPSHG